MDHEEKEKIFAALERIKEICEITEKCDACTFRTGTENFCGLTGFGCFPGSWKLDYMKERE